MEIAAEPRDRRLLIFAKAPIPGQVKTRLQHQLGSLGCAKLHEQLTLKTLEMACSRRIAPVELWCTPDKTHPFFQHCRATFRITLKTQQGENLGSRLPNALSHAAKHGESTVIIGTDCPEMDNTYLESAFHALGNGHDLVLGPAQDGGYVLIGTKQAEPALFTDIHWGTDQVLAQTRAAAQRLRWSWTELPTLRDIDRPEDLVRLRTTAI
jgi:rSAM/selenodomain-associated transferase 1